MQPSFLRGMRQDIHKKEYKKRNRINSFFKRAGDGNRTHVSSLEGWCSTIELHPHFGAVDTFLTHQRTLVYLMKKHLSTLFLIFLYFLYFIDIWYNSNYPNPIHWQLPQHFWVS